MPARDTFHDAVKNALVKDGWTITDDPLKLSYGPTNVYVDLGAERLLAAERQGEKIAVEIKTFGGASDVRDLQMALGQYVMYRLLLTEIEPERTLYLAITRSVMDTTFDESLGRLVMTGEALRIVVFDPETESIVEWKT